MTDEQQSRTATDHARVKFPPPLLFLLLIMFGWLLQQWIPLAIHLPIAIRVGGGAIAAAGLVFLLSSAGLFRRHQTAIEPWRPSSALVTEGIYAWTRNPIYLGFCMITAGLGIATSNLWTVLAVVPGAAGVYLIAIAKEEAYLEREFGEEYLVYKNRVRRWL